MAGAPKLLIAGKGYFDAESGLTAEALDSDSKNPGTMSEATIRDVTVEGVSADALKEVHRFGGLPGCAGPSAARVAG